MKISTSTNILCERADGRCIPMADSIAACAQAGFTELDFGFAELAFHSGQLDGSDWRQELLRYNKLADRLGVSFIQGHGTIFDFCNSREAYSHQLELLHRSIEGAAQLGIPWLAVHPSTKLENAARHPETHRENINFFLELSNYARQYGVGLAIENMWGYACEGVPRYAISAEEVLRLVEDIDRDNVGVCWDVEHAGVENLPQGDSIRLLGNHIKATHISDETGVNNIHILPYTGVMKWDEILRAFADIGYDHAFSLEIQHYLPLIPTKLLPQAMRLAYSVGNHLVEQLDAEKAAKQNLGV